MIFLILGIAAECAKTKYPNLIRIHMYPLYHVPTILHINVSIFVLYHMKCQSERDVCKHILENLISIKPQTIMNSGHKISINLNQYLICEMC